MKKVMLRKTVQLTNRVGNAGEVTEISDEDYKALKVLGYVKDVEETQELVTRKITPTSRKSK